jgi:hypothetical protein
MADVDAQARRKNDPTLSEDWYSAHRREFEVLNRKITDNLVAQAKGYDIALPPKSDASLWDEGFDSRLCLTLDGQRTLRAAIRKARRESIEWRVKVLAGVTGILTGIFVLLSHLHRQQPPTGLQGSPQTTVPNLQSSAESTLQPTMGDNGKRHFTNETPRQLTNLYLGVTALQADTLMKPFKGLWLKTRGVVNAVQDAGRGTSQIILIDQDGVRCTCTFQPQWREKTLRIHSNQPVEVQGKISEGQNGEVLYLEECELR